MNRKSLLIIISFITTSIYADSCLNQYKTQFDNKQINLVYDSSKPSHYLVGKNDQEIKDMCVTTYPELTKFINQHYPKTINESNHITIGWNYLSINNHVIYDYLNTINPLQIKRNNDSILAYADFKSYTVSNQANYQFISTVNNRYACYISNWSMMATAMAHPDSGTNYQCVSIIKPTQNLKISQIANESDIVIGILNSGDIKDKLDSKPSNIKTYIGLSNKFKSSNNDELNCLSDSINRDNTSFVINQLNPDETINITLGLTSDLHVCSGILQQVKINNLRPLIKINQVIAN